MRKYFFTLLFSMLIFHEHDASAMTAGDAKIQPRSPEAKLDPSQAAYRSQILKNISYKIDIDLTPEKTFTGNVKIKFSLPEPQDLTVDFTRGEVDEVKVNGLPTKIDYNQFFLKIKKQDLSKDDNLIEIRYRHTFGKQTGLVRFVDSKDKKIYIYSRINQYSANQIWPCFDQPDLLSTFELKVKTPPDWQVISISPQGGSEYAGGTFEWRFPRTSPLNIQAFQLAAGFYSNVEKNINTNNHPMLLKFWMRQSIAKNVNIDDWALATKNGFVFFEKEFSIPYKHVKYDQILIPSDSSETMDGFSLIFLSEKYFLGKNKQSNNKEITQIALEKLAGWWIGQNILPSTLEDLWISQSFAKYISTVAMMRGTLYSDADQTLLIKKIKERSLKTEQIYFWKWLENNLVSFNVDLKHFFSKFSQSSLSTTQFFQFWEEKTKKNIFQNMYFKETEKENPLQVSYNCVDGLTQDFILKSKNSEHKNDFSKIHIATYRFDGPRIVELKSVETHFQPPQTSIKALDGLSCSRLAFVLIDPQNRTYINWEIDKQSFENLKKNVSKIEDERIRFYGELLLKNR